MGPYPVTIIWTTAGETFATTLSRELSKSRSRFDFDDECASSLTPVSAVEPRGAVDCACAYIVTRTHATPHLTSRHLFTLSPQPPSPCLLPPSPHLTTPSP